MARAKETGIYKQPGSPYWYISFTHPKTGKQIRQSSKTTVKEMALQLRAKLYNEAFSQEHFGEPSSITFGELVTWGWEKHYSQRTRQSKAKWRSNFNALVKVFGEKPTSKIPVASIRQFVSDRLLSVSKATANRDIANAKALVNLAIKTDGMLTKNPFAQVTLFDTSDRQRDRTATEEERNLLVMESHSLLSDIIIFDLNSGLRASEIRGLRWDDINFEEKTMRIASYKRRGQVYRTIPIFPDALEVVRRQPRVSEWVFTTRKDGRYAGGKQMGPNSCMHSPFMQLVKRLGIKNLRFHDLRHTFATGYYRTTKNLAALSYILGHTSIKTTMIYLNLTNVDLVPSANFSVYQSPIIVPTRLRAV